MSDEKVEKDPQDSVDKTEPKLTAENVNRLFRSLFFKDEEDKSNPVLVEGIVHNVGFHPDRVKAATEEIQGMLNELPDPFFESKGGGWSFLNACNDKNDRLWTGEHRTMEQLVVMGIAIGKVKFLMERNMWPVFSGGMPYFVILDK